jgi:5'-nucleotidase
MPNNTRRKFLKNGLLASASFAAPAILKGNSFYKESDLKLTILHTNDVHSRLEPFPQDGSPNAGLGGVAARADVIKNIRNNTEHILLLDAGDIFQGTPYFNLYKGEPEMKAMSMMGYDAAAIGNHDFDGGLDNLALQLNHANFPLINCNYNFTNTAMQGKTLPHKIFEKGELKIGVLGVGVELQGLVPENLYGNTMYEEPITKANATAEFLKKQGCDFVICLSHLGDKYQDDKVSDEILAKQSFHIDLIIGGHTHRFFKEPRKYYNKLGGDVIVNQVGWGGINLGRLDYSFSGKKKNKLTKSHTVILGK